MRDSGRRRQGSNSADVQLTTIQDSQLTRFGVISGKIAHTTPRSHPMCTIHLPRCSLDPSWPSTTKIPLEMPNPYQCFFKVWRNPLIFPAIQKITLNPLIFVKINGLKSIFQKNSPNSIFFSRFARIPLINGFKSLKKHWSLSIFSVSKINVFWKSFIHFLSSGCLRHPSDRKWINDLRKPGFSRAVLFFSNCFGFPPPYFWKEGGLRLSTPCSRKCKFRSAKMSRI